MHIGPDHRYPSGELDERLTVLWQRGVRFAGRLAVAFGLSAATAIAVGAAVTDNAFAQILVTAFAALAFWIPFLGLIAGIERLFRRRPNASQTITHRRCREVPSNSEVTR